ncbi:hypothetical protein HUA76_16860 [Myxococcus sp. CA056]|nr:hypothetical protein [Myxococcus sp. CA056]
MDVDPGLGDFPLDAASHAASQDFVESNEPHHGQTRLDGDVIADQLPRGELKGPGPLEHGRKSIAESGAAASAGVREGGGRGASNVTYAERTKAVPVIVTDPSRIAGVRITPSTVTRVRVRDTFQLKLEGRLDDAESGRVIDLTPSTLRTVMRR